VCPPTQPANSSGVHSVCEGWNASVSELEKREGTLACPRCKAPMKGGGAPHAGFPRCQSQQQRCSRLHVWQGHALLFSMKSYEPIWRALPEASAPRHSFPEGTDGWAEANLPLRGVAAGTAAVAVAHSAKSRVQTDTPYVYRRLRSGCPAAVADGAGALSREQRS
jgi:hypothetical protein